MTSSIAPLQRWHSSRRRRDPGNSANNPNTSRHRGLQSDNRRAVWLSKAVDSEVERAPRARRMAPSKLRPATRIPIRNQRQLIIDFTHPGDSTYVHYITIY